MDPIFWPSVAVSGVLFLVVGLLHVQTQQSWQQTQRETLSVRERDFLTRRRHRRRQTNRLLAMVAGAILVGAWLRDPRLAVALWAGVILLIFWILLLAAADAVATRTYFARAAARLVGERAALDAELKRQQAQDQNGRAGDAPHKDAHEEL